MRILYIYSDNTRSRGVVRKVVDKVRSLNDIGVATDGLVIANWIAPELVESQYFVTRSVDPRSPNPLLRFPFLRRLDYVCRQAADRRSLFAKIREAIDEKNYDFVLMRYPIASKELMQFLQTSGTPVLLEHNTKELDELRLKSATSFPSRDAYSRELKFGKESRQLAAGLISVTPEISTHQRQRGEISEAMTTTITNGFCMQRVPIRTAPPFDGRVLRLLMLCSTPSPWHGEDRLIRGIASSNINVRVELILAGEYLSSTQRLVDELSLANSIKTVGPLQGRELDDVFNTCHLAVSPLAVHRKGLMQATPLKTREYLSRGIPVVYAYDDPDLPDDSAAATFTLKLDPSEQPIAIDQLLGFADRIFAGDITPSAIRHSAVGVIDMRAKAMQLRDFAAGLNPRVPDANPRGS